MGYFPAPGLSSWPKLTNTSSQERTPFLLAVLNVCTSVASARPASFFHEGDCRLGAHLTPLSGCHPVDSVTGDRPNALVALDEYRALVSPGAQSATARTLCQRLGINAAAWRTTIDEVGLFQGVAVGNRTSRVAFDATQGK